MTDYNDGKWHGWNGGVCPVHPETEVTVLYGDGGSQGCALGEHFDWSGPEKLPRSHIAAFRVVKEYREPRECWSYGAHIRDTYAEAIAFRKSVADANPGNGYESNPITHWREVTE